MTDVLRILSLEKADSGIRNATIGKLAKGIHNRT